MNSRGIPPMFWAPEEVFNCVMPNMLTAKKAEKKGGVHIPIGNELITPSRGFIAHQQPLVETQTVVGVLLFSME